MLTTAVNRQKEINNYKEQSITHAGTFVSACTFYQRLRAHVENIFHLFKTK